MDKLNVDLISYINQFLTYTDQISLSLVQKEFVNSIKQTRQDELKLFYKNIW